MPYIPIDDRVQYEQSINVIVSLLSKLPNETDVEGHFNYIVSSIIKRYLDGTGIRYYKCNKFCGALDCISKELYRRVVAKYEDDAITKNGDI
jgi:hypothetical protein